MDITDVCKLPLPAPCKPPMGRILTASRTVFINRWGCARILDRVLCGAAAVPGTEPGGCSHSAASEYRVRDADHYEKLMEVEHEASEFDRVGAYQREAYEGKRQAPAIPVGVPPSTGATAASKSSKPPAAKPTAGAAKPLAGEGAKPNPIGGDGKPAAPAATKGSGALPAAKSKARMGQGAAGKPLDPPTEAAAAKAYEEEKENERKQTQPTLDFPIDLKFGIRLKYPAPPLPLPLINTIFSGELTVLVGG
jgi:hypothetical protein